MFKIGLFDNYEKPDATVFTGKAHKELAYEIAKESIVLLKNEKNILPININKIKSIAVIGPNANVARTGGGGRRRGRAGCARKKERGKKAGLAGLCKGEGEGNLAR
jgi:beta-glucosidase-like glycosyl hydrolase